MITDPEEMRPCPTLLRLLVNYDPLTGRFKWRRRSVKFFPSKAQWASWNARRADAAAFECNSEGYCVGSVLGRAVRAHRVAWAIHHGEWPPAILDHKNGDPSDNRINNLRLATDSQNARNRRPWKRGASKYLGVFGNRGKWAAKIGHDGRCYHIGTFPTEEAAAIAYNFFAQRLHGQFARLNKVQRDPLDEELAALTHRERQLGMTRQSQRVVE